VYDVARACRLALESAAAPGAVCNVGSGVPRTIAEIARKMAQIVGKPHLEPEITGTYRAGDVRHCFADVRRAEQVLGFRAAADFDGTLSDLVRWLEANGGKTLERAVDTMPSVVASEGGLQ
jgi:dTDP-L-rhamnose 4-epimerase